MTNTNGKIVKNKSNTFDGFTTFGDAIRGKSRSGYGYYTRDNLTRKRDLLDVIYRQSWICAKICDCIAEDMTKDGVEFIGIDQKESDILQKYLTRIGFWEDIADNIRWSRLYGGSAAFIDIEGQDISTPLSINTIQQGQFKGLKIYDRFRCYPAGSYKDDPEFYRLDGIDGLIHKSRLIKMVGVKLPYFEKVRENWWGGSIISRVFDRIRNRDNGLTSSGKLINKAYVRTVKVKGLRNVLAAGGQAEKNLVKMFTMMRDLQDNSGLTILDLDDEFNTDHYTFSGLDSLLSLYDQDVAAAADIPMTRLYGQSPAGFSTGDADLQTYYSRIASNQKTQLSNALSILLPICYSSRFNKLPPADFDFSFSNVWNPSEIEDRQQIVNECNCIISAANSGIIDTDVALEGLRTIGRKYNLFNSISDEDIERAKPLEEPPMDNEADLNIQPIKKENTPINESKKSNITGVKDIINTMKNNQ